MRIAPEGVGGYSWRVLDAPTHRTCVGFNTVRVTEASVGNIASNTHVIHLESKKIMCASSRGYLGSAAAQAKSQPSAGSR